MTYTKNEFYIGQKLWGFISPDTKNSKGYEIILGRVISITGIENGKSVYKIIWDSKSVLKEIHEDNLWEDLQQIVNQIETLEREKDLDNK